MLAGRMPEKNNRGVMHERCKLGGRIAEKGEGGSSLDR